MAPQLRSQDSTAPSISNPPSSTHAAEQPGRLAAEKRERAAAQIKAQEHQRILGVFPSFNVSNIPNAVAMTPKQKFQLAFKSALDPVTFGIAAFDAGLSQWEDEYKGYGQGAQGYAKRWGASYADTFDGDILGNALFPVLLHQDPRYFRKAVGTKKSRLWYAIASTARARGDNGHWQPNYSNILGNLAAGGISNLYYPSNDRGAGLTIERAYTVTAEGTLGAIFIEFWPDVSHKLFRRGERP